MPLVESFHLSGCRCWFYSDDHQPAHFHASVPGEWEARVFFLPDPPQLELVFSVKRMPGRMRRDLLQMAEQHRISLLEEWSEKVHVNDGHS